MGLVSGDEMLPFGKGSLYYLTICGGWPWMYVVLNVKLSVNGNEETSLHLKMPMLFKKYLRLASFYSLYPEKCAKRVAEYVWLGR